MFIFMRSLYSFYGNLGDYKNLAQKVYDKTNSGGLIAITDISAKYNLQQMLHFIVQHKDTLALSDEKFIELIATMLKVFREFNDNIDKGNFTILSKKDLVDIFCGAGFSIVFIYYNIYIFQRVNDLPSDHRPFQIRY